MEPEAADRLSCDRCRRPRTVCYCGHIPSLPTRTRVLLLQHPKERRVGIGTARMAHLSLPNSVLRVGLDFSADPVVTEMLEAAPEGVCVLFPKAGARDIADLPLGGALTLVVLDGTWSLARKLLKLNPALAALPRVAFTPRHPSAYRIRRQPAEMCVSTIEALAEVLNVLEPDNGPFDRLLAPFHAMVARQVDFITGVNAHRHRHHARVARPKPRQLLAARLRADWSRLVCVQGDANAWPRRDAQRVAPEIVHWVAHRPSSGETYEAVVAPRRPLASTTPGQIELSAERLGGGESVEEWRRTWGGFWRPDDIVVSWGTFYLAVAASDGLPFPAEQLDLRAEFLRCLHHQWPRSEPRSVMRARVRTVDGCAQSLELAPPPLGPQGRAGRRLAALVGVVGLLARDEAPGAAATPV